MTNENETNEKEEWEVVGEDRIRWEAVGEKVVGILKEIIPSSEGRSAQYVVETDEGEKTFYGGKVLDMKLSNVSLGDKISVEYIGEGTAKPGRNPPKLFKTMRSKKSEDDTEPQPTEEPVN